MRKIKTVSKVNVIEIDGKELAINDDKIDVAVYEHWNYSDCIVLCIDNGRKFTVGARDLRKAIENAINAHG